MPGPNAPYTNLDASQVIRQAYNETTDRIRVDADITVDEAQLLIDYHISSIAVGDPVTNTKLTINPDGSINADVVVAASGGDSILAVGTEDGTTSGTQHVLKVGSDLNLRVRDDSANTTLSLIDTHLSAFSTANHADLVVIQGKQDIGNTSLSSINTKVATAANQTSANTKLDTLHSDLLVVEGKQDTGNTSLGSIDGKIPASLTVTANKLLVDNSQVTQPIVDTSTGTWANGVETAVAGSAVQVIAANSSRKKLLVQNTGANAVRIGIAGVTATTGFKLAAGACLILTHPYVETNAIFAIQDGILSSTVLTQETT